MTTKVVDRASVGIAWDHFLKQREKELSEGAAKSLRAQVEGFRIAEWPAIVRYLARDYSWEIPDGLEPHWVSSGKAVYWQEGFLLQGVDKEVDGVSQRVQETVSLGWNPTGPLNANNPSQMNTYLSKGFCLRPPQEGVSPEVLQEAAVPSEGFQEPQGIDNKFFCGRHPQGRMGFISWKAYINHCSVYREDPIETPPMEQGQKMSRHKYFCAIHDRGFKNQKAASQHRKAEMRRMRSSDHPTLEQMKVPNG